MKILEQIDNKTYFLIQNGEKVKEKISPLKISKNDLLKLMTEMYYTSEEITIPSNEEIHTIQNPIEREIVEQIINKLSSFKNNIEYIKQEVETQFPKIKE